MSTRSGIVYEKIDNDPDPPSAQSIPIQLNFATPSCDASCASSSRPVTRKLTNFWLIGHPSASITGSKLPDRRQAMKYFLQLRHDVENIKNKVSNNEIAYTVADTVIVFWQMAKIKTKSRQNCMLDVISQWLKWDDLAKN